MYAALERLTEERLIEVDREAVVDARLRRYYRITGAGAARLTDEVARLRQHLRVAADRLGLDGVAT